MRVILGESLTSLLISYSSNYASEDYVLVDTWEGGSTFFGWDISRYCIDRAPILLNPSCPYISNLRGLGVSKLELVKFDINLIGTEEGFRNKFANINVEDTWIQNVVSGGYIPVNGWCSFYRYLRRNVAIRRIYGFIKFIDIDRKLLKVSWYKSLRYRELLSTLPLHYLITKIITNDEKVIKTIKECFKVLNYIPTYIVSMIIKGSTGKDRVVMIGRKGFQSALVVTLRPNIVYPFLSKDYTLIYVVAPIHIDELKPELNSRILGEKTKYT